MIVTWSPQCIQNNMFFLPLNRLSSTTLHKTWANFRNTSSSLLVQSVWLIFAQIESKLVWDMPESCALSKVAGEAPTAVLDATLTISCALQLARTASMAAAKSGRLLA